MSSSLSPCLFFLPQVSSSTRKERSCTGSNEPFSHTDQPLPDPISPWTHSAIEAECPFIPLAQSIPIHPSCFSPSVLLASPASMQPSRWTCVHHGDKAERGSERGRGGELLLSLICAGTVCVAASLPLSLLSLARPEPQ